MSYICKDCVENFLRPGGLASGHGHCETPYQIEKIKENSIKHAKSLIIEKFFENLPREERDNLISQIPKQN